MVKKAVLFVFTILLMASYTVIPAFSEGESSLVLSDFDAKQPFQSSNDSELIVSRVAAEALQGAGSLKVEIKQFSENGSWQYISQPSDDFMANGNDYDGFSVRLKTNAAENAILKIFTDGDFGRAEFGGDVTLLDLSGNNVTPVDATGGAGGWFGFVLPDQFDGYVFLPFSGDLKGSSFDTTQIKSLLIGFVGNQWNNSITHMDTLAYYKGNDFDAIITELGYGSHVISEEQAVSEVTATTSTPEPKISNLNMVIYALLFLSFIVIIMFLIKRRKV